MNLKSNACILHVHVYIVAQKSKPYNYVTKSRWNLQLELDFKWNLVYKKQGNIIISSGAGTNLKVGAQLSPAQSAGKKMLVVPLTFLALQVQLVVLVSAFMTVSTIWFGLPSAQPFALWVGAGDYKLVLSILN